MIRPSGKYPVTVFLLVFLVCSLAQSAGRVPWQRRVIREFAPRHKAVYRNLSPDLWPAEPEAPGKVDPERFASAIRTLCGIMPAERAKAFTEAMLNAKVTFGRDPFLMAALMWDRSRCVPQPKWGTGTGLFRVLPHVYAPHVRSGRYSYYLHENDKWERKFLDVSRFRFNEWSVIKSFRNIYFAAAFLKVWELQHQMLDRVLGGKPHRHHVSHWFFGDRVRNNEPEDRVLTVRRRFIGIYKKHKPLPLGKFKDIEMVLPLDGAPRLVLSPFGMRGEKKHKRLHQGIDLDGQESEPVRAAASGKVVFAGLDRPGNGNSVNLTPEEAAQLSRRDTFDKGGLYIIIAHGNGVRTFYMHLHTISVTTGDRVKAGDVIGSLGRTGVKRSGPHLHFELRADAVPLDPAHILAPGIINPWSLPEAPDTEK